MNDRAKAPYKIVSKLYNPCDRRLFHYDGIVFHLVKKQQTKSLLLTLYSTLKSIKCKHSKFYLYIHIKCKLSPVNARPVDDSNFVFRAEANWVQATLSGT